ncbi:CinA family protein, partial [Corallococcus sp. 4LFB]|uniref:CinA family protein n=1 Tax=Corallococcus sp. 4LFB TaxID=3383249 RepID=UPI003976F6F0
MSELEAVAPKVIGRCREVGVRLVLAEACTGGVMAAALTEVPGASAVVDRGFGAVLERVEGRAAGGAAGAVAGRTGR